MRGTSKITCHLGMAAEKLPPWRVRCVSLAAGSELCCAAESGPLHVAKETRNEVDEAKTKGAAPQAHVAYPTALQGRLQVAWGGAMADKTCRPRPTLQGRLLVRSVRRSRTNPSATL